jgi:hypothetical protein
MPQICPRIRGAWDRALNALGIQKTTSVFRFIRDCPILSVFALAIAVATVVIVIG